MLELLDWVMPLVFPSVPAVGWTQSPRAWTPSPREWWPPMVTIMAREPRRLSPRLTLNTWLMVALDTTDTTAMLASHTAAMAMLGIPTPAWVTPPTTSPPPMLQLVPSLPAGTMWEPQCLANNLLPCRHVFFMPGNTISS